VRACFAVEAHDEDGADLAWRKDAQPAPLGKADVTTAFGEDRQQARQARSTAPCPSPSPPRSPAAKQPKRASP